MGDDKFLKQFSDKSGIDMKAKDRGRPKKTHRNRKSTTK
jgi:hypothetical protein